MLASLSNGCQKMVRELYLISELYPHGVQLEDCTPRFHLKHMMAYGPQLSKTNAVYFEKSC